MAEPISGIAGPILESPGVVAMSAAFAMAISALATAWSQSSIGSSAMGAVSEKPEIAGNVIIWIAIPETLAILGFIIAYFLVGQISPGH